MIGFVGRHVRSLLVVVVALAMAGIAASLSLPVGLFPQVSFPRIVVDLDAGDRPASQTAMLLTRPVEAAIRNVPGVRDVRSNSTRGSAQVSVDFGWGIDMTAATLEVEGAVARTMPSLPAGASYNVRRMDPTVFPIIAYALTVSKTAPTLSPADLRALVQLQIVPLLSSIPGLARVAVQGGESAETEVLVDPHRLDAHGLAMADVVRAVSDANVLQAVGRLQDRDRLYLVLAEHDLGGLERLRSLVLRPGGMAGTAGLVSLRDVATVQNGAVPQWTRVSEDGKPAVLFNVFEQPDGNAVQVAAQVRSRLAAFAWPKGVSLVNWYDQSTLVVQSAASVRDAVLIGLVLAGLVLLVFLRNWRLMLIVILVVPATLAISVLSLALLGLSFNIMTLGGIAAAVGLLIDDVIVMVEHIAHRCQETPERAAGRDDTGKGTRAELVMQAGREFLAPLTGSSLATLVVFLPLGFLSGVTGAFSRALSITMGMALLVSYLLTAFVVPILSRYALAHDTAAGRVAPVVETRESWLSRSHAFLLDGICRKPWLLVVMLVPLLAAGAYAYSAVPTGFMPAVDEGGFVMDYYTRPGTSLDESDRELAQVDAILSRQPEVLTFSRRLGTGLGGDLGQSYHGDYFVRLKPDHARTTLEMMAAVLSLVQSEVPGVQVELAQLMEDLIGDLTSVPQPVEVKLYAVDPALLIGQARKVAAALGRLPGVVEVKDGVELAGDSMTLRIDPVRAAVEDTSAGDVARQVADALAGTIATSLPEPTRIVGVRVRLQGAASLNTQQLADLPLRAADGHLFPLSQVARLVAATGEAQISRENLQPMIAVTGRIEGRGIGAVIADVNAALHRPGVLDSGVRYELGGLYAQQRVAFAGLARVFAAALVAEFILLLFLYENFALALIVICTALLSTLAVFIALWLTNVALNITALMGMTMIIGIGAEMAIFYVSEYAALSRVMPARLALREASRNRLRPITMTTLAAILTLLPLALAIGAGSGIQQPLAIAIIAGLMLQYPLVLLAMPAMIGFTVPPARSPGRA